MYQLTAFRVLREFDPWKSPYCTCPLKYSLHPYTGCSHFCLYCYATSYIGRRPSKPKDNFLRNLSRDLARANRALPVELSTSSDPYPPIERVLGLTRRTVEALGQAGFKVLITTKSDLVARDADLLSRYPSAVMITITTLDEALARRLEPGAPSPRSRLLAIKKLSEAGVPVGVRVDPVLPGINDDPSELYELVMAARDSGALHVVTSTYKAKWDSLGRILAAFPELESTYRALYVERGERIRGYMYLPRGLRAELLRPVIKGARDAGLTYATCREALGPEFMGAPSCDGTHLIGARAQASAETAIGRGESR
ncbi:MAG: radical SAM protein [Desulfurococcaceae archaeon]